MPNLVKKNISKIKNVLIKEQTEILETAFILMLPSLLTKVTGQLFNLIAASYYGSDSPELNKFFIANAIPELLATVLMVGAVGAVVIPVLITAKEKDGEQKFYEIYSSILNLSLLVFSFFSLILIIFAGKFIPAAIEIVSPDEVPTTDELHTIANMMRVLIIPQLVLGISVYISSGLNVYHRYIVPQLSPLFFNAGRIAAILILVPLMNFSAWSLVIGVIVGSLLHLFIQVPVFLALRIQYVFKIDFKSKYIKEVATLGLPRMFVAASDQIGIAVNKFIAYPFIGGTASFVLAFSLYQVIPSLFGYTFSYASYPTLSKLFIEQDFQKIRYIIQRTLNEIAFFSLPFVVTIMVMRVPIVRLVYGIIPGTNFQFDDTYQVAWVLLWFTFGLVFITGRWFLLSIFYAAKDTLTPSIITIFSLISVISLSILFTNWFSHNPNYAISSLSLNPSHFFERSTSRAGVGGISLAMSVTYTIEFMIMLWFINKRKVNIHLRRLVRTVGVKFIAAFVMLLFMYLTYKTWNALSYTLPESAGQIYRGSTTINLLVLSFVTVAPAFMVYFLICHYFKVEELRIIRKYLNPLFGLGGLRIKEQEPANPS